MINVKELMDDPDFASKYTVLRTQGKWVKGRFTLGEPVRLKYFGPVQPATEKELEQLAEGDIIRSVMRFMCKSPKRLYTTQELYEAQDAFISDQIIYLGELYKIIRVKDWRQNGYTRAFAYVVGMVKDNG